MKSEPPPRPARHAEQLRLRRFEPIAHRVPTVPNMVSSEFEQVGQNSLLQGAGAAGRAPASVAGRVAEAALP